MTDEPRYTLNETRREPVSKRATTCPTCGGETRVEVGGGRGRLVCAAGHGFEIARVIVDGRPEYHVTGLQSDPAASGDDAP